MRSEITGAAERLFLERGYDATTIEDVAAAVGMSARSVFRYFPTKEDLLLGKLDGVGEQLVQRLRERPDGEAVWVSLRSAFHVMAPFVDGPDKLAMAARIQEVVFTTASLHARYLEKMQAFQAAATATLRQQAAEAGTPYERDDPRLEAVVASAFGCLLAAQRTSLTAGGRATFGAVLDRAMSAVAPTVDAGVS